MNLMSGKIRPKRICIEASSVCQLKCPSCPTATQAIQPAIGSGFLEPSDFTNLIEQNPWIEEIELSNYGEMFLNPDLLEIMKYAYDRNVVLRADNGVNLNTVEETVLEGLVKYGFRSMSCSIDGASNETYRQYRVGGDFELVMENIRKINNLKKRYRSQYPYLAWQFVIFGHNEHEIPAARELAQKLGMEFRLKLSWDSRFSPVKDKEFVRKEVGAASREEYREKYGVDYSRNMCHQLWDKPHINWDGKILACARNFWGDFGGNAFEHGLLNSLNTEKIRYARDMVTGKKDPRDDIPCATCSCYLDMKANDRYLSRSWLYLACRFMYRKIKLARYRRKTRFL